MGRRHSSLVALCVFANKLMQWVSDRVFPKAPPPPITVAVLPSLISLLYLIHTVTWILTTFTSNVLGSFWGVLSHHCWSPVLHKVPIGPDIESSLEEPAISPLFTHSLLVGSFPCRKEVLSFVRYRHAASSWWTQLIGISQGDLYNDQHAGKEGTVSPPRSHTRPWAGPGAGRGSPVFFINFYLLFSVLFFLFYFFNKVGIWNQV